MRNRQWLILGLVGLLGLTRGFAAEDLTDHPGYVDFSQLTALATVPPTVEVNLKAPLLELITNILRNNDEVAAAFVSTLIRVTVQVFEDPAIDATRMAASMAEVADGLDAAAWERVVRVRDDQEHVDVYFRLSPSADLIHGIAIMVAEPGETVLVNIVGDISPADVSAVAAHFDIDALAEVDVEANRD